jgi:hypothetical protein
MVDLARWCSSAARRRPAGSAEIARSLGASYFAFLGRPGFRVRTARFGVLAAAVYGMGPVGQHASVPTGGARQSERREVVGTLQRAQVRHLAVKQSAGQHRRPQTGGSAMRST